VMIEAMACGTPVIAARCGSTPEIIDDGVTGFTCDPDDTDAMAARAIGVLTDPVARVRIGRAAAASVRSRFCVDRIVPLYENYYREVLEG